MTKRKIWGELKKRKTWVRITQNALLAAIVGALVNAVMNEIRVDPWESLAAEERPIREIIEKEANLTLEGKIDEVVLLYHEEAFVRDAAGGNTDQEIFWNGINRVAERYRDLPEFTYLKHDAIEIAVSSDRTYARAIADTIGTYKVNGTEVKISSNQGEKWTFEKINGNWKITSFTYNLP